MKFVAKIRKKKQYTMKMSGNNHDRFWVFIDDRRLPLFKPRPGLHR